MRRKQRELFVVALSSIALFLLVGVTFALSPVFPYLFEDGDPSSSDASTGTDVSSPDAASTDPAAAGRGKLLGAVELPQIDLSMLAAAAAPGETGEPGGPDKTESPSEPDKAEKPNETDKAEKPSESDKTEKPSETDKAEKPSESDKTEKPSEADKTEKPSETDKTEKPSETDEPGDVAVPNEPGDVAAPSEPEGSGDVGATAVQVPAQQSVNGQTYVSLSSYAQAVDPSASVSWDGWAMTVTAGGTSVAAASGQAYLVANGRYLYIPSGVKVIDGQLYVPDSVAAKAFSGLASGDSYYDQNDLFWLSRVIYRESGNQGLEGQMAVGNVILNRVASSAFPGTIEGVLAQQNQFPSYASGVLQQTSPSATSVIAAKLVLDGGVVGATRGATYFSSNSNSWAAQNKQYIATFGGHNFYG